MQVMYLSQQQARKLKAGEGRVAEGVSIHSLPDGIGTGVEMRLFALDPEGVLASSQGEGERHFFVLSGVGEVSAARSEVTQPLNRGALLSLNADEGFSIRNTGASLLQLLYIRPTGAAANEPAAKAEPSEKQSANALSEAAPASPTKGKRAAATQVREEPTPYTPLTPVNLAAASGNTALRGQGDGSDDSRRFRMVFEGRSDEQGKGFGTYRVYPPPIAGQPRPEPFGDNLDFEEMSAAQAAYQTLIHALEDLAARISEEDQELADWQLDISGNNRTAIRQLQGESHPKSAKAQELLDEATALLDQFGGYILSYSETGSQP